MWTVAHMIISLITEHHIAFSNLDMDDYNNYANSGIKINQSQVSGQIDWQLK